MSRSLMLFTILVVMTGMTHQTSPAHAVPQHVGYQGELRRNGELFDGEAQFKFVIFSGNVSLWSNDGTSVNLSEPSESVPLMVEQGIFSVRLGEEPMEVLAADALAGVETASLRIWVNTGGSFEQLSDQPLSSSPFSLHAESADRAVGGFTADGVIHSTTGGFRFPDGTLQSTAAQGGGGEGGTLDQAYDYGGPGAGRTIVADAGPVAIAGTDGLTVSGRLGVGTDSPEAMFHVGWGSSRFDGELSLRPPNGSASNPQVDFTGGYLLFRDDAGAGDANTRLWFHGPTGGEMVFGPREGSLYLDRLRLRSNQISLETSSGGGSQFKLLQNGNVGIGTATPTERLHVLGTNALFEAYDGLPFFRVESSSGRLRIFDQIGVNSFELRGNFSESNRGSWIALKDEGQERITLAAENGATSKGGLIDVKNDEGQTTIRLIGDVGDGKSRIITSVVEITGGADLAEPFPVSDAELPPLGSVLVIDDASPGHLKLSDRPYDRRVAGVVSGAGGVSAGLTMGQQELGGTSGTRVALTGRVYVLSDATHGPIQPGDLMTTSDRRGHAMAARDPEHALGTILGKAMSGLTEGQGLVLVLVNLQ